MLVGAVLVGTCAAIGLAVWLLHDSPRRWADRGLHGFVVLLLDDAAGIDRPARRHGASR